MRTHAKMFWYKTFMGAKPFDEIYRFIRVYDETRYLVLFEGEKHDFICTSIRYLKEVESGITYVISHYYVKTQIRFIRFFTFFIVL